MRTHQHVTDTRAVKRVIAKFPDSWVIRGLSERDYGIDLMVEVFAESGEDNKGKAQYEATGRVCFLQIKGTTQEDDCNQNNIVPVSIPLKSLLYAEKFATPFILVKVFLNAPNEPAYFCWMQRYILEILDRTKPDWRDSEQSSLTVNIPSSNLLDCKLSKIERIASRIKYIEEAAEFHEIYAYIRPFLETPNDVKWTEDERNEVVVTLKRVAKLATLLQLNQCQVRRNDIINLLEIMKCIKAGNGQGIQVPLSFQKTLDNLDLLSNDHEMRMYVEQMVAESEGDVVY